MNNNIIKKININIYLAIEYNSNINYKNIFRNNIDYDYIINYYLKNIYSTYNKKIYLEKKKLINIIYNNCKCNRVIKEEASLIVDDIMDKLFHQNQRNISLPLNINSIIDYSISSIIKQKEIENVLKLFTIKIAIINYCFIL